LIVLLLAVGTGVFSEPGAIQPRKEYREELANGLPQQGSPQIPDAAAVSFRLFVPVEVYIGRRWEPAHGFASLYAGFHTLMGWILIPVVIASLTGLLRREPPT
jgi:hypothetical protein